MMDLKKFLKNGAIVSSSQGKVYVGWGKRTWMTQPDSSKSLTFYFPDYFLSDKTPWFSHENCSEIEISELLRMLKADQQGCQPEFIWENRGKELFASAFSDLQDNFKKGILKKGVPYIFETAEKTPTPENLHYLVENVLEFASKHPVFVYGFWDEERGMLGATPEMLFHLKMDGGKAFIDTVACAGTCPKEEAEDFINDPKQLHEHNLVVDGILESLHPFGDITRGSVEVLPLANLCHLITPIKLTNDGALEVEEIVKAIHPTPALGAFPKAQGMKWLGNYQEKINRKRYGAPVGYMLSNGDSSCYVAIRNVQWMDGITKIGAGCGIVPQSDLNNEWDEIQLKVKSIKNILGL